MRHLNKTKQLKRSPQHRRLLLANLSSELIKHGKIRTTVTKAKALRPVIEKLITNAKEDSVHQRRQAFAFLRNDDAVKKLFGEVAAENADRPGGYCRITKLGVRTSDAAPMAFIEIIDFPSADEADDEESED